MNMKKVTVSRIAKKQIIHHCLMQADRIPVALQRNRLYTTASRPDSSRIAKKQILHHCPVQADRIPVALQRNRLYTTFLCKQTGFQSHCKETDYTPFARRLETSTFYHQYINFGSISYINTYLDFSSPFFS